MKLSFTLFIWLGMVHLGHAQSKSMTPISKGDMPAGSERRLALVVGNKDYRRADARLTNPLNDADDMARALEALGFDVILKKNLTLADFKTATDEFGSKLSQYNVALFYYSGHGLQFNGENYLVPIDANLQTLSDAEDDCLRLGRIMGKMKAANTKNNLVFLDACRNNPFPKSDGSKGRPAEGLTIPNNPPGTMVVFATEEGSTADDNASARNGLFTSELLLHLSTPNLSIGDIVLSTRQGVYRRSNELQLPSDYNKMLGVFYFIRKPIEPTITPKPEDPPRIEPAKPTVRKFLDLPFAEMAYVTGGSFDMGSTEGEADEKPQHRVTVSGLWMGKYEVTVEQFETFVEAARYQTDAEKEGHSYVWNGEEWEKKLGINWRHGADGSLQADKRHPVINVSHNDALAFCGWLSKREGRTYRLPTEAEWEYAAGNGGAHTKYSWGRSSGQGVSGNVADETGAKINNWTRSDANIFMGYTDGFGTTAPVGQFSVNTFGLFDMTGNVWEWCGDWYGQDYYASSGATNPTGPSTGSYRVLRGGSWNDSPQFSRVAYRNSPAPSYRASIVGFRVVAPQ
jgi:formylglycine-generating enzyme required for sulfatase activity